MNAKTWLIFLLTLCLSFALFSCGDDDDDDDDSGIPTDDDDAIDDDDDDDSVDDDTVDDDDDDVTDDDDDVTDDDDDVTDDDDDSDPGDAIDPSANFLDRQAEYLQQCSDDAAPDVKASVHSQVCRVYTNQTTYNQTAIDDTCTKIDNREDTSDFDMASVLRMLYLDKTRNVLPPAIKQQLESTVLNFKYWLDEPGYADMCWWSENHQVLFHSAELLAGQLFKTETFPNSGMTGQDHIDHALPKLQLWLDRRGTIGFVEWHSNVYFNEDMPALLNLVDFAEDETVSTKAAMLLDIIAFDFANHYYKGQYATTHGRTYPSRLLGGLSDSTREAAWMMLGIADNLSSGNFTAAHMATSDKYWPPVILEDFAAAVLDNHEAKERVGIDLEEASGFGMTYTDFDDLMYWWSASAYPAPQVIDTTFEFVDYYDMWDDWFWRDIAALQFLVGSPLLEPIAYAFNEMTRGAALEAMSTYTWRTPDYQLSGAQYYKPGYWAAQNHIWQATIDKDAYVFTTYPGGIDGDYMAGPWTGGWLPGAHFYQNVGIVRYERRNIPILDSLLFVDYTHAYFPKTEFDEVREPDGHWTLGRKGDVYVALYSQTSVAWATNPPESDYELIADSQSNVWILELGTADDFGDFDAFETAILAANIVIGTSTVLYDSPSQGEIHSTMAADGLMVNNVTVPVSYQRWEIPEAQQPFGDDRTIINYDGQRLDLDFDSANPRRRYWENYQQ